MDLNLPNILLWFFYPFHHQKKYLKSDKTILPLNIRSTCAMLCSPKSAQLGNPYTRTNKNFTTKKARPPLLRHLRISVPDCPPTQFRANFGLDIFFSRNTGVFLNSSSVQTKSAPKFIKSSFNSVIAGLSLTIFTEFYCQVNSICWQWF